MASGAGVVMKPPPIVEGHNLQPLHPADQQWVGTHQQQSPAQPVQQQQHHNGSMITDEIRFSIIDAVYLRPGIWDCQREKTVGPSRKELFVEVTNLINQQNQLDPELTPEEVEKQWKNLKDTYVKTRKKLSYNNDSIPVTPKWKFYSSLMFLDDLFSVHRTTPKRRLEEMSGASSQCRKESLRYALLQDVVIFARLITEFLFAWNVAPVNDETKTTARNTHILTSNIQANATEVNH